MKDNVEKILHAIKSKSIALKNAAEIFKDLDEKERKEMIDLMKSTSRELADLIKELE